MTLNNPLILLLILFIPLLVWFKLFKSKQGAMKFSSIAQAQKLRSSLAIKMKHIPLILNITAIILIIISLAKPQKGIEHSIIPTEGIDIILAIDVSTSMLAEDFTINGKRVNRLVAIKPIVKEFINNRTGDRIGIVVFAGKAYTQCPLTLDYSILQQFLGYIQIGMIEDGTAIGSAIATCVNRLKDIPGKSKVIILLTDGRNNMGKIDPLTAAEMAKTFNIKIYTIGAGSSSPAPYPVQDIFGNRIYQRIPLDLDSNTLKEIAKITGGMYFRAANTKSLHNIYEQIDKLEKTKAELKIYMEYKELFPFFLLPGLCMLISGIILSNTWLRKIP